MYKVIKATGRTSNNIRNKNKEVKGRRSSGGNACEQNSSSLITGHCSEGR